MNIERGKCFKLIPSNSVSCIEISIAHIFELLHKQLLAASQINANLKKEIYNVLNKS